MQGKKDPHLTTVLALKTQLKTFQLPDKYILDLEQQFPTVKFHLVPFNAQNIEHISEADILYSYSITPSILANAPRLKWFHAVITGPNTYTFPEILKRKITVSSPKGVYSTPIAETVLGLMLALGRKINKAIHLQTQKKWGTTEILESEPPPTELNNSTITIVGVGGVGTAVARLCHAIGMHVIGVVPTTRTKPPFINKLLISKDLDKALPDTDFLVLACPLTNKTNGLIGKYQLGLMKKGAFLINVARGALVDEYALVDTLENGRIGGAACDVFASEPLPTEHPFYTAPNMIITPHIAGISSRFWERAMERFVTNLKLYLKDKPLIGVVDFKKGY